MCGCQIEVCRTIGCPCVCHPIPIAKPAPETHGEFSVAVWTEDRALLERMFDAVAEVVYDAKWGVLLFNKVC
jgi:hypothetical protein